MESCVASGRYKWEDFETRVLDKNGYPEKNLDGLVESLENWIPPVHKDKYAVHCRKM